MPLPRKLHIGFDLVICYGVVSRYKSLLLVVFDIL